MDRDMIQFLAVFMVMVAGVMLAEVWTEQDEDRNDE
jgi:hypothetical protein